MQLSQEATFLRMRSTDFNKMSRGPGHNMEIKSRLVRAEESDEGVWEDAAERNDLLLQLRDYEESKQHFTRTLSD